MKDNSFNEIGRYWRLLADLNGISNEDMNELYNKFMMTKEFKEWDNKDNMDIIFSEDMFNKFMDFYKKETGEKLIILEESDDFNEDEDLDNAALEELIYRIEHAKGYDSKKIKDVKPRKGESKKDFIARFMKETKKEYPDEKQRAAIAYSYWNRRNIKDSASDFYNVLFRYFENESAYNVELENYPTEESDYLIRIFDKKDNLNYKELKELLKDLAEKYNVKLDWVGTESGWRLDGKDIKTTYTIYFTEKETEVKDSMLEELQFPFKLDTDNFYLEADHCDDDLYSVYYSFNFSNNLEGLDKEEIKYFNNEKEAREFINQLLEMDSKEFSDLYFEDSGRLSDPELKQYNKKYHNFYIETATEDDIDDYEFYYDNFIATFDLGGGDYSDAPLHHLHYVSKEDLLNAIKKINPEEKSTDADELYKRYYKELLDYFRNEAEETSWELLDKEEYSLYNED